MAASNRPGNGWINIPEGKEPFTYERKRKVQTGTGPRGGKIFQTVTERVTSRERHYYNPQSKERITLRQYQNLQREQRANAGIPAQPSIPRTGRTRTIRNLAKRGESSLYDPARHGKGEAFIFRDLESARNWVLQNSLDERYHNVVVQIRYAEKLRATNRTVNGVVITGGSPRKKKRGYATITPFRDAQTFKDGADYTAPNKVGSIENPWFTAEKAMGDYKMGSNSRVYILMTER